MSSSGPHSAFRALLATTLVTVVGGCGSHTDARMGEEWDLGAAQAGVSAEEQAATKHAEVTLHPLSDLSLCFAAEHEQFVAGSKVILTECTAAENQRWHRYGEHLRLFADKCAQVQGGVDADGSAIVLGECKDGDGAMAFDFTQHGFAWSGKNRCVTVAGALAAGTPLEVHACEDGQAEQTFGFFAAHEEAAPAGAGQAVAEAPKAVAPKASSQAANGAAHAPKAPPAAHAPIAAKASDKKPVAAAGKEAGKPAHADKVAKAEPKPQAQPGRPAPASKDGKAPTKAKEAPAATGKGAAQPAPATVKGGTFGPTPAGTLVAPYFYDWGSPTGFAKTLVDVHAKAGVQAASIAFGLSGGGCKVAGFGDMGADIKAFRKLGGQVVLSFGGQSGTYLQATCQNASSLAAAILGEMATYDTHLIDFDVEGENNGVNRVTDPKSNGALMAALLLVQSKDPAASISFTLAADDGEGISGDGFKLMQLAASKGVRVARVNLMAMDYGHKPAAGKTTGDMAIATAEKAAAQMQKIWPKASQSEVYHAIGITPMIGQNDGNADGPFLVTDAAKVAAYAKQKGIGLLAYWAMQRDLKATGDYNDHSNHQSVDFAYFKALSAAQ